MKKLILAFLFSTLPLWGQFDFPGDVVATGTVEGTELKATTFLQVAEISTPTTPASTFGRFYFKTDGKPYALNDAGTEVDLTAGGGGAEINDLEGTAPTAILTTEILIGTGSGTAAFAAMSGDATMSNSGVVTIAAGAVDVAMLANGVDGELITWDASGAPTTVAVGTATHVLTSNGAGAAPTFQALSGGGDALVANPLSQFAATTSAQLAGVISDETGSGAAVFADSPTLDNPVLGTITSGVGTTLTALNGENIQDDTIDDDSIDFGTGTDQVSAADIPIADTGSIFTATDLEAAILELAKVAVNTKSAGYTIGTDDPRECYGGLITVTAAATIQGPVTLVTGMSWTIKANVAGAVVFNPDNADTITLEGLALAAGDSITSLSALGDIATFVATSASAIDVTTNGWTDTN